MTQTERIKYGKEVERMNRRYESLYYPKVFKAIQFKADQIINVLKRDGLNAAKHFLHTDISNVALSHTVGEMYKVVGLRHAQRVSAGLNREPKKKSFFIPMQVKRLGSNPAWIRFIQQFLAKFLLEKITFAVNVTTRNALLSVLDQATEIGWGETEIVSRLSDLPFTKFQAARIVRTEVGRAAEVGTAAASETFPFEQNKEWIAIRDNRTRGNPTTGDKDHADHYRMDGQIVDSQGRFKDPRSGNELRFPKDPAGEAEDVINCRCTHAVVAKRDVNGRMIPKVVSLFTQSIAI